LGRHSKAHAFEHPRLFFQERISSLLRMIHRVPCLTRDAHDGVRANLGELWQPALGRPEHGAEEKEPDEHDSPCFIWIAVGHHSIAMVCQYVDPD
jgi:hypothetical protein